MARESKSIEVDPYVGLRTRAHWKPTDAARVLRDCSRSGEPLTEFARRHGLGVQRLKRWNKRLSNTAAQRPQRGEVRLVPVVLKSPVPLVAIEPTGRTFAVSVVVDAVRIELADAHSTDPRWVAALVHELRGARS